MIANERFNGLVVVGSVPRRIAIIFRLITEIQKCNKKETGRSLKFEWFENSNHFSLTPPPSASHDKWGGWWWWIVWRTKISISIYLFIIYFCDIWIRITNKCRFQIQYAPIQNYFEFDNSAAICKCLIVYLLIIWLCLLIGIRLKSSIFEVRITSVIIYRRYAIWTDHEHFR